MTASVQTKTVGRLPATSRSIASLVRVMLPQAATGGAAIPAWKRSLDLVGLVVCLPLALPLSAAVTIWIKFASHGPVLFHQERIGRCGKRFYIYKFRTMHLAADTAPHTRHFRCLVRSGLPMTKLDQSSDPRLIPGASFIRAAGLDELPQLFNIWRGEMSLVGPRPCLPEELRYFAPHWRNRFEVLPGITGLSQVYGKRCTTFSEMNVLDAYYARRASFAMDLAVLAKTPITLATRLCQALRRICARHPLANHLPAEGMARISR